MESREEYIREKDVSYMTGMALSTLRNNRFRRKGIPYIKVGRSVRYSKEDVIAFMEKRKIQTESLYQHPGGTK